MSSRFSLLTTDHLSSQDPDSEVSLQSLIENSDRMAEEAREVLPYSFDECTYSKGYLRQSVWSCLDCGEKGVCYGCSISCHAEHRLVELWTKRKFRCDCPTTSMQPDPLPPAKRRKCTLNPPAIQPAEPNIENTYSKNFGGKFCRCGRDYDPETEEEAMINCIACEDWLHETCLNLRPFKVSNPVDKKVEVAELEPKIENGKKEDKSEAKPEGAEENVGAEEEDEEEKDVLIPSESYDGLICADCVKENLDIKKRAGQAGWMIIEPNGDGSGFHVVGKESDELAEPNTASSLGEKRPLDTEDTSSSKKMRTDFGVMVISKRWQGKGDVFLANGVRDKLKAEGVEGLPFPLVDEEIYEPPRDEEPEETLDDVTNRVMDRLPRVQAIEAVHGYQNLKSRLSAMISARTESGHNVISKEDIEGFFAELRQRS